MKQYQHLSSEERFYIHQAVREGHCSGAGPPPFHDRARDAAQHVAQRVFVHL